MDSWFQLSHDFSVMEMKYLQTIPDRDGNLVSIEPRLFSHGNAEKGLKRAVKAIQVSIEPRLFSHGNSCRFSAFTAIGKKPIYEHSVNYTIILQVFMHSKIGIRYALASRAYRQLYVIILEVRMSSREFS